MNNYISVPIDYDIYNEFLLRSGKSVNVATWIENIVADFLDRTDGDGSIWEGEQYLEQFSDVTPSTSKYYGPIHKGVYWQNLFLKNGTKLKMIYGPKGMAKQEYFAEVRYSNLYYEDKEITPSKFANQIAGHPRNAWRDILIQAPNENSWKLADTLRRSKEIHKKD